MFWNSQNLLDRRVGQGEIEEGEGGEVELEEGGKEGDEERRQDEGAGEEEEKEKKEGKEKEEENVGEDGKVVGEVSEEVRDKGDVCRKKGKQVRDSVFVSSGILREETKKELGLSFLDENLVRQGESLKGNGSSLFSEEIVFQQNKRGGEEIELKRENGDGTVFPLELSMEQLCITENGTRKMYEITDDVSDKLPKFNMLEEEKEKDKLFDKKGTSVDKFDPPRFTQDISSPEISTGKCDSLIGSNKRRRVFGRGSFIPQTVSIRDEVLVSNCFPSFEKEEDIESREVFYDLCTKVESRGEKEFEFSMEKGLESQTFPKISSLKEQSSSSQPSKLYQQLPPKTLFSEEKEKDEGRTYIANNPFSSPKKKLYSKHFFFYSNYLQSKYFF